VARVDADPEKTAYRRAQLTAYMKAHVLAPTGFCCASFDVCRQSVRFGDRFYEGQLSHVGHRYDLFVDGRPVRIVIVGQEYGLASPSGAQAEWRCISLDDRHKMIVEGSGLSCRYYASDGRRARNPHMRGTTSALRVAFGKELGSDWDSEFITARHGGRFHLFDAFALVNVLLCSAGPPKSSRGRSTPTMRRNCLRHFRATLDVLEPTLVILQGVGVRDWLKPILEERRRLSPHLIDGRIGSSDCIVCEFTHPSAHGQNRWGDKLTSPYLSTVVEPTINHAVDVLTQP
jgi:hypothetical protein